MIINYLTVEQELGKGSFLLQLVFVFVTAYCYNKKKAVETAFAL